METSAVPRALAALDARIDGPAVVVSSAAVLNPIAVRYAWQNEPQASLHTATGSPRRRSEPTTGRSSIGFDDGRNH